MLTEFWTIVLAVCLLGYLVALLVIGLRASQSANESAEEYLLAGRNLPLPMAIITLIATWFGAGVMLTVTDEVAENGISAAVMDPLGVALCLVLAGWWLARPLWNMKILTVCDFFRRRFNVATEKIAAVILIPSYFGWIAVQFVVVAKLLKLCFGIDPNLGIVLVMAAGTLYTLLGGLRAVVWTDVFQLGLVLLGVVWLGLLAIWEIGFESTRITVQQAVMAKHEWREIALMLDLLVIGSLGNLPAQDLVQRFLCVKSARAASQACYLSGGLYFMFGLFPILLGLISINGLALSNDEVVMSVAAKLMSGPVLIIFILAVISAVLSTIDGAILSPASVLAQNLIPASVRTGMGEVTVNRVAVILVALLSLATAFSGQSTYGMLEEAYSLMLVGLFVPLVGGLWFPRRPPIAAIAAMLVGTMLWLRHLLWESADFLGEAWLSSLAIPFPTNTWITLIAVGTFFLVGRDRRDAALTC